MPSFPGPLPYAVKQPYEALLASIEDVATESDCGYTRAVGGFKREGDGKTRFDSYLHLGNWRERGSSAKERIHILVHVQETIRQGRANYVLEHSTVYVHYFRIENGQAVLLHGVHFDHGPEEQDCHPVFHAHVIDEPVTLSPDTARELDFEFPQTSASRVFKNARIPTSDMTLPSVLLCLAADHLKAELFTGFLARVRELQAKMPQPVFAKTKQSIHNEPDHMRSSHWFAHM